MWLAGLLEGEGCFALNYQNKNRYRYPLITLGMTDQDTVQHAADLMGVVRIGRKKSHAGHKQMHEMRLSGSRAAKVMLEVLPYMSERRSQRIRKVLLYYIGTRLQRAKEAWMSDHDGKLDESLAPST